MIQQQRERNGRVALAGGIVLVVLATLGLVGCGGGLSGTYTEQDGVGKLEFKGDRVYVTTLLGMTFVASYETDGNHVIIRGAGGSQVYTIDGNTLDGGGGVRFVKQETSQEPSATQRAEVSGERS
ncbi:MAG: hypothetical protein KF745_00035 [Phycisphaeraceae bacterium]|nr:hypothetical protein [Phycisphaeraceae bacterium]